MNIIYRTCEIAATMTETAIMMEFINKLFGSKLNGMKNIIHLIFSFVLINGYMIIASFIAVKYSAALDLGYIFLFTVYTIIFMKGSIIYKVITPIITSMSILFINLIVSMIASNIFNYLPTDLLESGNVLRIFLLFITKFTFFILTRFVLKTAKPKDAFLNKQELIAVSMIFVISAIIIGFSGELYYSENSNSTDKFLITLLIGLAVINITVFLLFGMIAKKNREKFKYSIMEMQYEEQKKSYDSVQTIYHNLQILQHDLKNELLCVFNFIENNQNDEAKKYITKITDTKLNQFHEYIKTGNEIIDAVINVKLNLAREKNIDIVCNINTDFCGFDENDIIRLFSNAIDNAIESCIKQQSGRIKVNIENKRNYLGITIGNTIRSSVLENNSELKTTKKGSGLHGLGTQSMKNITEKYDGMIEFYENGNMFITNIMIKSF
ncbi:MAG: GHKL domain-containing protein [Clostridium sp.]|nr:GHKL domain-containing protein [Clostridium sp.]